LFKSERSEISILDNSCPAQRSSGIPSSVSILAISPPVFDSKLSISDFGIMKTSSAYLINPYLCYPAQISELSKMLHHQTWPSDSRYNLHPNMYLEAELHLRLSSWPAPPKPPDSVS